MRRLARLTLVCFLSTVLANVALWVSAAQAMTTDSAAATPNTGAHPKDLLIKFSSDAALSDFARTVQTGGAKIESLGGGNWARVLLTD